MSALRHLAVSTPNLSKIDEGRKNGKLSSNRNQNNNSSFNGDLRRPWVAHRIKSSKSSVDISRNGVGGNGGLSQITEDSSDDDISVIDMCQDGGLERYNYVVFVVFSSFHFKSFPSYKSCLQTYAPFPLLINEAYHS